MKGKTSGAKPMSEDLKEGGLDFSIKDVANWINEPTAKHDVVPGAVEIIKNAMVSLECDRHLYELYLSIFLKLFLQRREINSTCKKIFDPLLSLINEPDTTIGRDLAQEASVPPSYSTTDDLSTNITPLQNPDLSGFTTSLEMLSSKDSHSECLDKQFIDHEDAGEMREDFSCGFVMADGPDNIRIDFCRLSSESLSGNRSSTTIEQISDIISSEQAEANKLRKQVDIVFPSGENCGGSRGKTGQGVRTNFYSVLSAMNESLIYLYSCERIDITHLDSHIDDIVALVDKIDFVALLLKFEENNQNNALLDFLLTSLHLIDLYIAAKAIYAQNQKPLDQYSFIQRLYRTAIKGLMSKSIIEDDLVVIFSFGFCMEISANSTAISKIQEIFHLIGILVISEENLLKCYKKLIEVSSHDTEAYSTLLYLFLTTDSLTYIDISTSTAVIDNLADYKGKSKINDALRKILRGLGEIEFHNFVNASKTDEMNCSSINRLPLRESNDFDKPSSDDGHSNKVKTQQHCVSNDSFSVEIERLNVEINSKSSSQEHRDSFAKKYSGISGEEVENPTYRHDGIINTPPSLNPADSIHSHCFDQYSASQDRTGCRSGCNQQSNSGSVSQLNRQAKIEGDLNGPSETNDPSQKENEYSPELILSESSKSEMLWKFLYYISKIKLEEDTEDLNDKFLKFATQRNDIMDLYCSFILNNKIDVSAICFVEDRQGLMLKRFYITFFRIITRMQLSGDQIDRIIITFLKSVVSKKSYDLLGVLSIVPYIPSTKETHHILYELFALIFEKDCINDVGFFLLKTPSLIGIGYSVYYDVKFFPRIADILHSVFESKRPETHDDIYYKEENKFDLDFSKKGRKQTIMKRSRPSKGDFQDTLVPFVNFYTINPQKLVLLGIIYYCESKKVHNFNYTGVLEYITDDSTIRMLKTDLLLIMELVHKNYRSRSYEFTYSYVFALFKIALNHSTIETTYNIIQVILRNLISSEIKIIFTKEIHVTFQEILSTLRNRKFLSQQTLTAYVELYKTILERCKAAPFFYNYILMCVTDLSFFDNEFLLDDSRSFNEFYEYTLSRMKIIDEFPLIFLQSVSVDRQCDDSTLFCGSTITPENNYRWDDANHKITNTPQNNKQNIRQDENDDYVNQLNDGRFMCRELSALVDQIREHEELGTNTAKANSLYKLIHTGINDSRVEISVSSGNINILAEESTTDHIDDIYLMEKEKPFQCNEFGTISEEHAKNKTNKSSNQTLQNSKTFKPRNKSNGATSESPPSPAAHHPQPMQNPEVLTVPELISESMQKDETEPCSPKCSENVPNNPTLSMSERGSKIPIDLNELVDRITQQEDSISWIIDVIHTRRNESQIIRLALNVLKKRVTQNFKYEDLYILLKGYNILGIREKDTEMYLRHALHRGLDFKTDPAICYKLSRETCDFYSFFFMNLFFVVLPSASIEDIPFPDKKTLLRNLDDLDLILIQNTFKKSIIERILRKANILHFRSYFFNIHNLSFIDCLIIIKRGINFKSSSASSRNTRNWPGGINGANMTADGSTISLSPTDYPPAMTPNNLSELTSARTTTTSYQISSSGRWTYAGESQQEYAGLSLHRLDAVQIALTQLKEYKNQIVNLGPQFIQILRNVVMYDRILPTLLEISNNHFVAHQLIWNLKANLYLDENKTIRDPCYEKFDLAIREIREFLASKRATVANKQQIPNSTNKISPVPRLNRSGPAQPVDSTSTQATILCTDSLINEDRPQESIQRASSPVDVSNSLHYNSKIVKKSDSTEMMGYAVPKSSLNQNQGSIVNSEYRPVHEQSSCSATVKDDESNISVDNSSIQTELDIFEEEERLLESLTRISLEMRKYHLNSSKEEKRRKLNEYLAKVNLPPTAYVPFNPDDKIIEIVKGSARVLQSHSKVPFMASFKIRDIKGQTHIRQLIFKHGDDCRQDILALQIINMFKKTFDEANLDIFLYPYKVIATDTGSGIIEVIPNSKSRDQIGRENINNLSEYFEYKFGFKETEGYLTSVDNFVSSLVGYSLVVYFLNIKDRHNGNILIDDKGCMVHIDFGFMLEVSPGNLNIEGPLKLTKEIEELLGGKTGIAYRKYEELMVKGFLALRRRSKDLVMMIDLFVDSGLKCYRKNAVDNFISRFKFHLNDREAKNFIIGLINGSSQKLRTWIYDQYQKLTNNIAF